MYILIAVRRRSLICVPVTARTVPPAALAITPPPRPLEVNLAYHNLLPATIILRQPLLLANDVQLHGLVADRALLDAAAAPDRGSRVPRRARASPAAVAEAGNLPDDGPDVVHEEIIKRNHGDERRQGAHDDYERLLDARPEKAVVGPKGQGELVETQGDEALEDSRDHGDQGQRHDAAEREATSPRHLELPDDHGREQHVCEVRYRKQSCKKKEQEDGNGQPSRTGSSSKCK